MQLLDYLQHADFNGQVRFCVWSWLSPEQGVRLAGEWFQQRPIVYLPSITLSFMLCILSFYSSFVLLCLWWSKPPMGSLTLCKIMILKNDAFLRGVLQICVTVKHKAYGHVSTSLTRFILWPILTTTSRSLFHALLLHLLLHLIRSVCSSS